MRSRRGTKSHVSFSRYGGKGIQVCARWSVFENFLEDMGVRPDGTTLDRKESSKDYEPGNCCWATPKHQARQNRKMLAFNGETRSIVSWATYTGIPPHVLYDRLNKYGMSVSDALTKPVRSLLCL